jgi:6-phosphofructo-2-kinase/fructose-2,6-biphosphatase 2
VNSPDYKNMNTEMALRDFLKRIEHYQEKYMALDEKKESDLSFMKIYNTGKCSPFDSVLTEGICSKNEA